MKKKISLLMLLSCTSFYINAQPIEPVLVPISNAEKHIDLQMGKYEVTVKEFTVFAEETGFKTDKACHLYNADSHPSKPSGTWNTEDLISNPYRPVVCMGIKGALAYAKWLAEKTKKPYRLPTFEEWKFAASAGKKSRFAFGEDLQQTEICQYENVEDVANAAGLKLYHGDRHEYTVNCNDGAIFHTVVGMYRANQFGLHDMMGNVREYVADCVTYEDDNPEICKSRAVAGEGWHWVARPVDVLGTMPENFYGSIEGFRLVLDNNSSQPITETTKYFKKSLAKAQQTQRKQHLKIKSLPSAPEHLIAKLSGGNKVKLSWQSNDNVAESYSVYRQYLDPKNKISRKITKVADSVTKREFTDTLPGNGAASYQVFATNSVGESMASNEAFVGKHHSFSLDDKIEAEHYSLQKYAYIRSKESEESVYFDSNRGHYAPGRSPLLPAWVRFEFDSDYNGPAMLTMRLKARKGTQVELWQDYHLVGVVEANDNKEFTEYKVPVSVIAGNYPLEVRAGNKKRFQLDWLQLDKS